MSKTFGPTYDAKRDGARIGAQRWAVLHTMIGLGGHVSAWWTLAELEERTRYPQASISAQLRHLRKKQFGGFVVEKRIRKGTGATWEYQIRRPAAVQLSLGMTA